MADHDLAALWEAHCNYKCEARDVDATMATMATMVSEPYVNHVRVLDISLPSNTLMESARRRP